ncbi:15662_t:CDS:2, partial [Racocetra fulgida]
MFETVNNKEEIIKVSINLIWKASDGKVVSVSFNDQLRSATIVFDNGTNTTVNLNAPGVILMNEETFRKTITEFARKEPEEPVLIEGIQDHDESSQVEEQDKLMHNVQTNANNTFNSDYEITGETVVKAAQPINKIFKTNNRTQADDIESIQDNDHEEDFDVSDDDSPEWSECEKCYGNEKKLCEYCGCSVCKRKGDRGHILLCDGPCGKNFHTRCLNPPLARIPPGKWYCKKYE